MEHSIDREKVIEGLKKIIDDDWMWKHAMYYASLISDALVLLKEQEAEIRQLRLALDIAKGTCKGIKSGGGQFADMPTMQPAT